jgi:hypothetical protein
MISISAAWVSPPPPGNVNALTGVAMPAAAATVAAMTSFRIALSVIYKPLPSIERATLCNVSGVAQDIAAPHDLSTENDELVGAGLSYPFNRLHTRHHSTF